MRLFLDTKIMFAAVHNVEISLHNGMIRTTQICRCRPISYIRLHEVVKVEYFIPGRKG